MQVNKQQVSNAIIDVLDGRSSFFLFDFDDPSDINEGSCEEFAFAVISHLDYPENLKTGCASFENLDLYGHVWLELTDEDGDIIYFDSEAEYGVESPGDLPYFIRN